MLQSLLQPRDAHGSKMIGALPAVAVRHERRRQEKRNRRPSQLALQPARSGNSPSPTPSPLGSRFHNELYVCGKVGVLHAVVGSLLIGIVVMVVGLVQLSPGAEASKHRFYLLGIGAALIGSGVVSALLRCLCLHWYDRRMREHDEPEEEIEPVHAHAKNGVSYVDPEKQHRRPLKQQASVTSPPAHPPHPAHIADVLVKQPSAASDT